MLTQKLLHEYFSYDPLSGQFTCIKLASKKARIGDVMGSLSTAYNRGYVRIGFQNKVYLAHKLAWLYVYGDWPIELDHINHNRADNRISNLRLVTHSDNMKNQRKCKNNTSGVTGVNWDKQTNKWRAEIMVNRKGIKLGRFTELQDAIQIRKQAEIDYGFHPNHGN